MATRGPAYIQSKISPNFYVQPGTSLKETGTKFPPPGSVAGGQDDQSGGGSGGESGGFSIPSEITTRQEMIIPDFLKPIIQARGKRTRIGNRALTDLRKLIDRGNLVAPLNADQRAGLDMARRFSGSEGLRQAIETVRSTAAGEQLDRSGINILEQFARGNPPDVNTSGEGFQNAFEAAVRRTQPRIRSTFANAGRLNSGLSRVAETQAAADSFASLFNSARERQLRSAQQLGNLFNQERGRQLNAAQIFPEIGQAPARIRGRVGDVLQQQRQKELSAPLQARENFAQIAAGSAVPVPIAGLTGSTTTQPVQPTPLIQNLTAAGIDPSSEQGRNIILGVLNPSAGGGGSDFGSAISGGLGGAGVGFSIGGPVGAGIGGGLGFLGGLL